MVEAYHRLLMSPDEVVRAKAAKDWCDWEMAIVAVTAGHKPSPRASAVSSIPTTNGFLTLIVGSESTPSVDPARGPRDGVAAVVRELAPTCVGMMAVKAIAIATPMAVDFRPRFTWPFLQQSHRLR